jgi:ACS family sodium-dependent inorganic phosphate cotransporter
MTFASTRLPRRTVVVLFAFLSVLVCYIDRVAISVAIIPMAEDLGWSPRTQGAVLSSFFVGYLMLQIAGGRLADRFGGKVVLGVGVLLWSLFTVLTPSAALAGFGILLAVRVAMGMGEALTFPSIYSIYGRWIPLDERSRAVGLANSGIPLGTIFALVVTPYIVERLGWQWAFYLFGVVGVLWFVAWQRLVTAEPSQHPGIGAEELRLIEAGAPTAQVGAAPPLAFFLARAPI